MFLINKIVFLLNFICAGALALAYLAPSVDPEAFWPFAFFGLAYPILLVLNVAFIVYWIIFKKLRFLISLGLIVLGWGHVNNIIQVSGDSIERTDAFMRIASFNTKNMSRFDYTESSFPEFYAFIDSTKPDVMCLQEFFAYTYKDDNSLNRLGKEHGFKYSAAKYMTRYKDFGDYGNVIISKYPILSKGEVPFDTSTFNTCVYADIVKGDDTVRVYSLHLQSIGFKKEDYKFIENINEDTLAVNKSKNIIERLKIAFKKRAEQAKLIHAHIKTSPYKVIVCGDFNDTPTSYAYNKIRGDMKDAFKESGSGISRTYIGPFPSFRIDHILFDYRLDGFNYTTYGHLKSDHKLIMTDLLFR